MMGKIRIGLIGLGGIAQKVYLPVLTGLESVEIASVMSRRESTVRRIQVQHRLTHGTTDLGELVRQNLSATFVLTPSPTHAAIIRQLLEACIDVFVEKPCTLTSRETAELSELADKRGRVLMVGFNRRFAPLYRQAKELFGARPVGLCLLEKHRQSATHPNLFENFIDDTIHIIDLLRWYGGEGRVVATSEELCSGRLVGAVSTVALDGGGIGIVATSLQAGGWIERLELHGGGCTVQVDAFTELRFVHDGHEEVFGHEQAGQWMTSLEVRGFVQEIEHFLDCVRTRGEPLTSVREAWRTQVLLEEMVAAAKGAK
jgi:virulence factor